MPARRLVVAAASGVAILSMLVSETATAANRNGDGNKAENQKRQERTTTTERRRTTTTERQRTTTTERERTTTTARRTTTTAARATTTTRAQATRAAGAEESEPTTTSSTVKMRATNRYVVVLKKGNRASAVAAEHTRTRKVKVQKVYAHAVRGYAADIADDEIDAIKKDKRVAYVERSKPVKAFAQTIPWGVERVSRIGDNWSSTRPGDGSGAVNMDIYVLDTGIQPMADLNGGTDVNTRGGPNTDCMGHGTHMAGIAAAIDNDTGFVGVAPGARVHGVKVLDCNGRGTDLDSVAGLDWVVQHGVRPSVVTMSYGGPISRVFDDAIRRAVSAGFVIVTAAGNDHRDACRFSPAHMGELNGVITVGSTNAKDRLAGFSNGGRCVDVYAPGVKIPSYFLNGALASATGTSASAPHVAGAAALYLVGPGGDSPGEVEAAIKSNAVRIGNARRALLRVSAANF